MTRYASPDITLLVGPYDLTNVSTKFEDSISDPVGDTTSFGVSAAQYEKTNLKRYEMSGYDGWYDDAATSVNAALVDLAAGSNVVMVLYEGKTAGKRAICVGGALKTSYKRAFNVGDFTKAAFELAVSGAHDDATLACPYAQVSGDGNTEAAYVDLGATGGGTTGGNVYLVCSQLALTGSANLVVTLEDSADHVTWADHTAFTALTAVGAEKKVASDATVNRYVAVKRAWTGLAGTPTATYAVALKVNDPH